MKPYLLLLSFVTLWMFKTSSLPSIYYKLSNKRSIDISQFRKLEKLAVKVTKWKLDIQYLYDCQLLGICPEFLKFKAPKLRVYDDKRDLYRHVLQNQINILERELKSINRRYDLLKSEITGKLTTLERISYLSSIQSTIFITFRFKFQVLLV